MDKEIRPSSGESADSNDVINRVQEDTPAFASDGQFRNDQMTDNEITNLIIPESNDKSTDNSNNSFITDSKDTNYKSARLDISASPTVKNNSKVSLPGAETKDTPESSSLYLERDLTTKDLENAIDEMNGDLDAGDDDDEDVIDTDGPNEDPILPKRYVLLLMIFLGFAVIYSLRVNINVAIVAMVNNRTRLTKSGRVIVYVAEFDWDSHQQALILGSFFYGYWVLQVPGAWIAMKLGPTRIFGYGVFLASLMSLITPVATRYHVFALAGVRIVQGLFLGVTYPCTIAVWAKWAPPLERSTMVTMAIAGSPVGNIIAMPLTGLLAKYGFDGGWPTVFYFFGFLGCIWYVVWEFVIYDSPEIHPTISKKEKSFITRSIAEKPFDPLTESPPWKAIFTSIPMWGIIIGHFGACWGYYTLFTQMPTYLKDIQHLDIKTMGLVAAIPYLFKAFLGPLGGISADILVRHKYLTIRGVRTLFYAVGCLLAGFFILMTGYYVKATEAIAFLILGVGFSGLNAVGYAVNHLDIAPRYAGILMGISNSFASIPGFLSPMVTGHIAKNKLASEWKTVFWITFIIYVVATALYTIMCSGKKQWWADGDSKNEMVALSDTDDELEVDEPDAKPELEENTENPIKSINSKKTSPNTKQRQAATKGGDSNTIGDDNSQKPLTNQVDDR